MNRIDTGADTLIHSLLDADVDLLFGYPGGAILPIYDALYRAQDRLRHILVRHEQGAVHAAQGYARSTGKIGVCMATSGPGAANFLTGMADALADSTPLLCISGQVSSEKLGTDAFQEADIIGLSLAATKWSYQVTRACDIAPVIKRAIQIATSGRPGPVLVDITRDAQSSIPEHRTGNKPDSMFTWSPKSLKEDFSGIAKAAELINHAQKPMLLLGHGVSLSGAENEAQQLAERGGIPTAATLLGLSAMAVTHPLYTGMLGMHGHYAPNRLTNEADVIIAVGMRFDDRVTGRLDAYARQAKIIHIDIEATEINRQVPAHVGIIGDAKKALQALLPNIQLRRHDDWLARFAHDEHIERQEVINDELAPSSEELHMGEVMDCLSRLTQGNAIIVSDVGQHQMMAARYYQFAKPSSHITSGGLGTMGFAIPAAIGATLGQPERPVIAIAGDGGAQMTLQELGTVMQEKIPLKLIILNNQRLGMVRQWQDLFFEQRYSQISIENPDFVMLARSYHIQAQSVQDRADLQGAIATMLSHSGPFVLEINVLKTDNIFPMIAAGASVSEIRLN